MHIEKNRERNERESHTKRKERAAKKEPLREEKDSQERERERERERELCVQSVVVFERDNLCVREQRKIREIFSLTA